MVGPVRVEVYKMSGSSPMSPVAAPPLAVHPEIARGPHRGETHVAGEDGILSRMIADRLRDLLGVDQTLAPA